MTDDFPATRELVFDFIVNYKRTHDGLAPSQTQIAVGVGMHESTVKYHLWRLKDEGRIIIVGRRGIMVVGGEWRYVGV